MHIEHNKMEQILKILLAHLQETSLVKKKRAIEQLQKFYFYNLQVSASPGFSGWHFTFISHLGHPDHGSS